ncbi:MAG: HAMP domain-containing sensor histidine kinase [Bacteroidota bacterium]
MTSSSPSSLRRLAGVLLALAVVPALAFAAAQVFVQSESEAQLAQIRDEQLDGLLFSVNQNAWDVATTWADRLAWLRANDGNPTSIDWESAQAFLSATTAVSSFVAADTALSRSNVIPAIGRDADPVDLNALLEALPPGTVRSLLSQHASGYRKLEPVPLPDGRLGLVFVADGAGPRDADGPPRVLCMIVEPEPFVEAVVMPKLREVALGGVELGVFRAEQNEPLAATASILHTDVERERPLWLLPAHTVGARVGEGSAESTLRRRLVQTLLLLGGVMLVLGSGAWVAWRGVSRELEVARMREDFVSNVSHELKTPLSLIRMYGESLAQGRIPEARQQRYFDTIVAESERLSRLVGNVLHFNRFERGTATMSTQPLDVNPLVHDLTDRYRPIVEREDRQLEVALEDTLPTVQADPDTLSEALVNLIDNAVKYGGDGPIQVSTHRQPDTIAIEVADRGPGIDAADHERVFDPFIRIQHTSDDGLVHTAKGTGLGLALVRRIAQAHGGTASVSPREGGGSVFRITLPT